MLKRVIAGSVIGSTTAGRPLEEERHDGSARPHHVAVADHAEAEVPPALDVVRGDEELVADELRRAVEVDRRRCLVGRQRDDPFDPGIERSVDDVLCASDVGLDELLRVVLARGDLLQRRRVHDRVDALEGASDPRTIADVAEEEAQGPTTVLDDVVLTRHLGLLQLVTGEDDEPLQVVGAA
jgi:hypothetical protein